MNATRTTSFVTAIVALAMVGCQETPTGPAASDAVPSFNYANGPAAPGNGNSAVVRSDASFDFLSWEETGTDDLMAYHIQANDIFFCGGTGGLPVLDVQDVLSPSGTARGIVQLDDAGVAIYRPAEFFDAFGAGFEEFCRFLAEDWLYIGTHRFQIVGQLGVGPTFGWTAHGDVTDQDGAPFLYSERATYVATGEGFREVVFEIDVQPKGAM